MNRQDSNRKILKILEAYIEAYPDQRFSQMLVNLDVVKKDSYEDRDMYLRFWEDEYNLEPITLLQRVRAAFKRIK